MAENTPNLGLLKKDPVTDGADTFNIQTMLNDNWDKIDADKKAQDDAIAGKETPTEAQKKADAAEAAAKEYAEAMAANLAGEGRTTETIKGNADDLGALEADLAGQKGSPYGVATLDATGNVPQAQLGNVEGMEEHGDEWHTEPYAKQEALDKTNLNQIDLALEVGVLKGALLDGVDANIFVETFQSLDDIELIKGVYDSENKRLYLP